MIIFYNAIVMMHAELTKEKLRNNRNKNSLLRKTWKPEKINTVRFTYELTPLKTTQIRKLRDTTM